MTLDVCVLLGESLDLVGLVRNLFPEIDIFLLCRGQEVLDRVAGFVNGDLAGTQLLELAQKSFQEIALVVIDFFLDVLERNIERSLVKGRLRF